MIAAVPAELVAGLAAGFALGALGVPVARRLLERGPRLERRLLESIGLPLLGRVPAGALDPPDGTGEGEPVIRSAELDAFREVTPNLRALADGAAEPHTVLVTSAAPQEEKALATLSLAVSSALAGRRTLLVECDLRRPSLARRTGIAGGPGLAQYLRGEAAPQQILQIVSLDPPQPGAAVGADGERELICIASGGPAPDSAELLGSARCREFVSRVSRAYEMVLLDAGPALAEADARPLMSLVDATVLCLRPGRQARREADSLRKVLGARPAGVVLTGGSR